MKRLSRYMFDRFGGWDLGCYNPKSKAGGGPSLHAEGRAQDFAFNAHDPDERASGDRVFRWAITHADEIGLQEILWRGYIWYYPRRGENPNGTGDFTGLPGVRFPVQQADHMSHVHLGVDRRAGMDWDPSWLTDPTPAPVPTPDQLIGGAMPIIIKSPSGERLLAGPIFTGLDGTQRAAMDKAGVPVLDVSQNGQAGEDLANALTAWSKRQLPELG